MKKLSVSKIIEFSRKSENARKTFLKQHNQPKDSSTGGGDYWASCISAIRHAFTNSDNSIISKKIEYLLGEMAKTPHKITKDMYRRNVGILQNFQGFNFEKWVGLNEISFLDRKSEYSVIFIKGVPIHIQPTHLFSLSKDGKEMIGAITFVAKLGGYNKSELAAYADALNKYLEINFSGTYEIEPTLCIAVDATTLNEVKYSEILNNSTVSILDKTINEIKTAA